MRVVKVLITALIGLSLIVFLPVQTSIATDTDKSLTKGTSSVELKAWKQKLARENTKKPKKRSASWEPSKYIYVPKNEYGKRYKAYQAELQRVIRHNGASATAQGRCTDSPRLYGCNGVTYLDLPADFTYRPAGDPAAPPAPVVTPQQAAYIATARLRLTPPKPVIGPPPSINPWKMAAVGYPMWLWADGNLNPAPVTDTVYDLTVSLDARLVKISYAMGDGTNVTCTDNTRRWTRSVPAGKPSPVCGHTYQEPSLPQGNYTITANAVWAIDWTVNGVTGTLPLYQTAATQLPVGELQVLTR